LWDIQTKSREAPAKIGAVVIRIGLHALGIGPGAQPAVIAAVARAAEDAGFATLWAGEHVVMVDESSSRSRYPYSGDGRIPIPSDADWLDPFVCLTYAAAATQRIALGTGVLLLPEHNPVLVAKQAASLDVLSGGRFRLGVGVGWSAEEFHALGVPFERRGARALEYVQVLRTLWADGPASFAGEFTSFDGIHVHPKPIRGPNLPVVFGGNSEPALKRVATAGDGWYGFNLPGLDGARDCVSALRGHCAQAGRSLRDLYLAVAVVDLGPEALPELAALGIDELVVVDAPPADPAEVPRWVEALAARWIVPAARARA
jgi:probable F420-dependent oxidoreductase